MAAVLRAVAKSTQASDLHLFTLLQHVARCNQAWLSSSSMVQQPRQLSISTSSNNAALAAATAAASHSPTAAQDIAMQSSSVQGQDNPQELLSTLITAHSSAELGPQHIGLYYDFNKALVQEAFRPFHQAFYSPRPAKLQRKGGCRSLQAELSSTSSSSLMWRRSSQELAAALSSSQAAAAGLAVHLQGPAGSGKSITLVQLVEWARSKGWLALYIPSAAELTRGGFFYPRDDGTYDTIISAQHILKSVSDAHDKQLQQHKLRLQGSKELLQSPAAVAAVGPAVKNGAAGSGQDSLRDLVNTGLSTDDNGRLAVECCLQLVQELAAASSEVPVLLAVDNYSALYWHTDYGRTLYRTPVGKPAYQYRTELPVKKLNLARGFRLLERDDLQQCRVVVADSSSTAVAQEVTVSNHRAAVYHMPRFSAVETAHALYYYHERGLVPAPPSEKQVAAMRALTNGSGEELRRWCVKVTQTDMGLL